MALAHLDALSLAVGFIVGGAVALAIANRLVKDHRGRSQLVDVQGVWLAALGPILAFVLVMVLDLLHVTK